MNNFTAFLLTKVFNNKSIPESLIESAFIKTCADIKYHFLDISELEIKNRIQSNKSELAIYLFRLGNELYNNNLHDLTSQIHWLLKELCSCEIYFNNEIGLGFYIIHGQATVIGSRNKIGKGFKIHQGCTIGHKKNGEGKGNIFGDNVTMYCNSSVLGELKIGDNVIIGAHVLVAKNIENNIIITSNLDIVERTTK